MIWLGMSIPTLPGSPRRPRSRHPGAWNIKREKEMPSTLRKLPAKPKKKPSVLPTPKTRIPRIPRRKSQIKGK